MLFDYAHVFVFIVASITFVYISLLIVKYLSPKDFNKDKVTTYECGERLLSHSRFQFNIRFYTAALIFLIFDVEIAFMYLVGVVFKKWINENLGVVALIEILIFVLILFLGLIYVWKKGDLQWFKSIEDN